MHSDVALPQSVQIHIFANNGDVKTSFTVRTWCDTVEDLRSLVFAAGTPSQRQQLFMNDKPLLDDGLVLALHGVIAESHIYLVSARLIFNSVPA